MVLSYEDGKIELQKYAVIHALMVEQSRFMCLPKLLQVFVISMFNLVPSIKCITL